MKRFSLFLSLSLLLGSNAFAETKSRYVIMPKSITAAAEIASFITDPANAPDYELVRVVYGPGAIIRGIVVMTTAYNAGSLATIFGLAKASVKQDGKFHMPVRKETSLAQSLDAGTLTSLNMWGPMRILATQLPRGQAVPASTTQTAQGTTVCVLDSGVNWLHPRLKNRVVEEFTYAYDPLNDPDSGFYVEDDPFAPIEDRNVYCERDNGDIEPCGFDDDGHGSHVAGIIAAEDVNDVAGVDIVGIDPTARLIAGKVLGWHYIPGIGYPFQFGYESDIANGIWECMNRGAKVINMSFGGDPSDIIHAAISDAAAAGVILVAAAGNEYDSETGVGPVIWPARHGEVISVAALGLDGKIAPFSSRGNKVDFIAPGVSILSTVLQGLDAGGYDFYSGTSMATPHVTGVISRMLANAPYAGRTDLVGTNIGLPRTEQGQFGLINAELSCRR